MKSQTLYSDAAVVVQSHLRRHLAKKEVTERAYVFRSLIKIQAFVRMIIAKALRRRLS